MASIPKLGTLVLVPNTLGPGGEAWLPAGLGAVVQDIVHWRMEEERAGRRLLAGLWRQQGLHGAALSARQEALDVQLLNEHTPTHELPALLAPLRQGHSLAIVSEAGMPAIADPGAGAVALAHQWGVQVIPLPGPSSLFLALAGSGLGGQQFAFHGYLPRHAAELEPVLRQLEQASARNGATQFCIEAPYRNGALLDALLNTLHANTLLCLATDLTLPTAYLETRSVAQWRLSALPDIQRRPTVFLWKAAPDRSPRN